MSFKVIVSIKVQTPKFGVKSPLHKIVVYGLKCNTQINSFT